MSTIPEGYEAVDPRTAPRVPLTSSLRPGVALYPGDPPFEFDPAYADTRTRSPEGGGYLLERVTSLGTHTASHLCAPAHVVPGAPTLAELGEEWTLMPLAVVDVRRRIGVEGPGFTLSTEDLRGWELRHGRVPGGGCVLLLTGYAALADEGVGETSPYVTTPAPGFSGAAVGWLLGERGVVAVGSDTLGPDATSDAALGATSSVLSRGGVVLANVGAGLARMRTRGDWVAVNGSRPGFGGFPVGVTGFTLPEE